MLCVRIFHLECYQVSTREMEGLAMEEEFVLCGMMTRWSYHDPPEYCPNEIEDEGEVYCRSCREEEDFYERFRDDRFEEVY